MKWPRAEKKPETVHEEIILWSLSTLNIAYQARNPKANARQVEAMVNRDSDGFAGIPMPDIPLAVLRRAAEIIKDVPQSP